MNPTPTAPTSRHRHQARLMAPAVAIVGAMLLSGCFTMVNGKTYAVGMERNRANIVIYRASTTLLHDIARENGTASARNVVLAATPTKIPITASQRVAMCAISPAICLSADQMGRLVLSWFRADVAHRSDFGEALTQAARGGRCFAWTFLPRRNLTHKANGTAGCRLGSTK